MGLGFPDSQKPPGRMFLPGLSREVLCGLSHSGRIWRAPVRAWPACGMPLGPSSLKAELGGEKPRPASPLPRAFSLTLQIGKPQEFQAGEGV